MIAKKAILAASAAVLTLGALVSVPAQAQVYVQVAPPPPRVEVVPAPRRGMVWAPGHWEWRNNRHTWVRGVWMRERAGYRYREPAWVENNGRCENRRIGQRTPAGPDRRYPSKEQHHPASPVTTRAWQAPGTVSNRRQPMQVGVVVSSVRNPCVRSISVLETNGPGLRRFDRIVRLSPS